jgi:hypothetical protein
LHPPHHHNAIEREIRDLVFLVRHVTVHGIRMAFAGR